MKSKLIKIFKNQAAFAMMEVMVAVGVLSAVTYGIMELIQTQNQHQKNYKLRTEAMGMAQDIRVLLMNSQNCMASFGSHFWAQWSTYTNSQAQYLMQDGWNGFNGISRPTGKAYPVGWYQDQTLSLSIYLTGYNRQASPRGNLLLKFDHYGGNTAKAARKVGSSKYSIPMVFDWNPSTNTMVNCYADENQVIETSIKEMCTDIGGTWTSASGSSVGNCIPPDFTCRHYGNTQIKGHDGTTKWAPRRWNGNECVPCTPSGNTCL